MKNTTKKVQKSLKVILLLEAFLWILGIIFLIPLFNMLFTSFKERSKIFDPMSFPNFTYWENYKKVFKSVNIPLAFGNTIIISLFTVALLIIFGSAAGYILSRSKKRFYKFIFLLFLAGMIIPLQTNMTVIYSMGVHLGLINTRLFLILLYASGALPFAILIYTGFTKSIPHELEEAASIDGCGIYRLFAKIIFPLLRPASATVFVTTIFWFWNDFTGPLLYLQGKTKQTLILSIFNFQQDRATDWGAVFALCVIATLPLVIFFMFAQKHLLKGLTAGAVKG